MSNQQQPPLIGTVSAPGITPTTPTPLESPTKLPPESLQDLPLTKRPHDLPTSEYMVQLYLKQRLDNQINYYNSRRKEFDANVGFMVSMGAGIMAVSSLISAIGATSNSAALALITALLPAFASLVASFRQLYQWEKQSSLYGDAALGLQEAKLVKPDDDEFELKSAGLVLPGLVQAAESVFIAEINQWGQITLGIDPTAEQDKLNKRLLALDRQDRLGAFRAATGIGGGSLDDDDGVG